MSSTAVNLSDLSNDLLVWRLSSTRAVTRLAFWPARNPAPGRCRTLATPRYVRTQQHYPSLHYALSPSIRRHAHDDHNHESRPSSFGPEDDWLVVLIHSRKSLKLEDISYRLEISISYIRNPTFLPRVACWALPARPSFSAHNPFLHHSYHLASVVPFHTSNPSSVLHSAHQQSMLRIHSQELYYLQPPAAKPPSHRHPARDSIIPWRVMNPSTSHLASSTSHV